MLSLECYIKVPGEATLTLPGGLGETQNPSPSCLIDFSEPGSLCSNKASHDLDMRMHLRSMAQDTFQLLRTLCLHHGSGG